MPTTTASRRTRHRPWSAALVALAGCGGAQASHGHAAPSATGPGGAGTARMYTDSDVVTGVAQTASFVYVATLRGLLRYPAAGGEPTRFTVAQGLPDNRVWAVALAPDGTPWVATALGVARMSTDRFSPAGGAAPDVGRTTALFIADNGNVLLGGAQGIARYDGLQWRRLSNQYQVLGFAPSPERGRVMAATAQSGVLSIEDEAIDEYGSSTGVPEPLARSVVAVGEGRFWALLEGPSGSKLGYFDGHRWWGYTHTSVRASWIAVVPSRTVANGAALVVDGGVYDLADGRGEALVAIESGSADSVRHVDLRAPASEPATAPAAAHGASHAATPAHAEATPPPAAAAAPAPHNVPAFAPPVEVPAGSSTPGAPHFGLVRDTGADVAAGTAGAFASAGAVFVARDGAGVARLANAAGHAQDFRTHDLTTVHRTLQVATDTHGGTWVVTDEGGAARFDGSRFVRANIDPDPTVTPLMVFSRGATIAAIGRVGTNRLRCYRYADNAWAQVSERRVEPGSPGVLDARFLGVDDRGRFWVGVRAIDAQGQAHEHGVALIDGNLPAALQFFTRASRGRHGAHAASASARRPAGRTGAVTAPDDLSAVEFDPADGSAWFAGISGATHITPAQGSSAAVVRTFTEADGLQGDVVGDLARGPSGRLFFATPEGLGYWTGERFQFSVEGARGLPHAIALAGAVNGGLWGISSHGVWVLEGSHTRTMDHVPGLEGVEATDIAIDGDDRVWFATPQGLTILAHSEDNNAATAAPSSGGASTETSPDETPDESATPAPAPTPAPTPAASSSLGI